MDFTEEREVESIDISTERFIYETWPMFRDCILEDAQTAAEHGKKSFEFSMERYERKLGRVFYPEVRNGLMSLLYILANYHLYYLNGRIYLNDPYKECISEKFIQVCKTLIMMMIIMVYIAIVFYAVWIVWTFCFPYCRQYSPHDFMFDFIFS